MPIPVGSTAFPPPLPVSPNKVSTVLMSAPVDPGDILVVQSATMQANTPVLALRVAKLDSTQFVVDMGVDPPTVKTSAAGIPPVWQLWVPTILVGGSSSGITTTSFIGKYSVSGKVMSVHLDWRGQVTLASGSMAFSPPIPYSATVGAQAMNAAYHDGTAFQSCSAQAGLPVSQGFVLYTGNAVPFPTAVTLAVLISGTVELP